MQLTNKCAETTLSQEADGRPLVIAFDQSPLFVKKDLTVFRLKNTHVN
jgi:hypothetical protein